MHTLCFHSSSGHVLQGSLEFLWDWAATTGKGYDSITHLSLLLCVTLCSSLLPPPQTINWIARKPLVYIYIRVNQVKKCRIAFTSFQENVNILRYSVESSLYIHWVPFSFSFLKGEFITKKYLKKSLSEFAMYQAQSELGFRDIKIWKIKLIFKTLGVCW